MFPGMALGYFFWTRHRRGLTLVGSFWSIVMLLCYNLPSDSFFLEPMVFLPLCACLTATTGYLVLVFTFSREVQLEACASGFPTRLRTLPLPTLTLAGWPMLWGSATMILGWVMLAWAVQGSFAPNVPLLWPGLLMAVVLAWLQAVVWTPLPLPWLRAFLLIPVSGILVFSTLAIIAFGVPSDVTCGGLLVLLLAAYGTAIHGVARARCGSNVRWRWPAWMRWLRPARTRQPFSSPARAQLWLEWRMHGLIFPAAMAACAIVAPPIVSAFATVLDAPYASEWRRHLGLYYLELTITGFLVLMFIWAAVGLSMEWGKLGRSLRLPSFLATRPVSEAMLVRAKFIAAAWSTLAGWGVLIVGLSLWLTLSNDVPEIAVQFETMRQHQNPMLFWFRAILLAVGIFLLTWMQMVQWMWMGLSGSRRVIVESVSGIFAVSIVVIPFYLLLAAHPEYRPPFTSMLPWLAIAAVLLKIRAALWSLHELRRIGLIPSRVLRAMLAIWFALAIGSFAALYTLLPKDWFSVPGVVLAIVLLLPLTRLALAPLALSWNRHR